MIVLHNGEETEVPEGTTGKQFLQKFGYRRAMVKLNGEQLQVITFSKMTLNEGDEITVKRISGGG